MGFAINQQFLSQQARENLFTFLSIRMEQFCSKFQLAKPVISEEYVSQLCKKVGINAVSYTHLDVYKRQTLSFCGKNARIASRVR